jgi:hypothetical protein
LECAFLGIARFLQLLARPSVWNVHAQVHLAPFPDQTDVDKLQAGTTVEFAAHSLDERTRLVEIALVPEHGVDLFVVAKADVPHAGHAAFEHPLGCNVFVVAVHAFGHDPKGHAPATLFHPIVENGIEVVAHIGAGFGFDASPPHAAIGDVRNVPKPRVPGDGLQCSPAGQIQTHARIEQDLFSRFRAHLDHGQRRLLAGWNRSPRKADKDHEYDSDQSNCSLKHLRISFETYGKPCTAAPDHWVAPET